MRILFVIGTTVGGVGRHVRSLAAGLAAGGHDVTVAGPPPTNVAFAFDAAGAHFTPVAMTDRPHPRTDATTIRALRRLARDADVVHAHGLRAGALAALARTRAPLVVTVHNAPPSAGALGAVYRVLEAIASRRAAAVLAVSPDLAARYPAGRTEQAVVAAPPLAPPAHASGDDDGRPRIVTVARLAEQKGLPDLLAASAAWKERVPQPRVVIAGEGPLRAELQARIDAEALPVELVGATNDVAALLASATVCVLASRWEGQPLVLQEMLRAGKPIVATDVGGMRTVAGDGADYVPSGNPSALASAVARLLDDPAAAAALAARAEARAAALPTEADAVAQALAVYGKVTAPARP